MTLMANVDIVGLISCQFWVGIDQSNSLTKDVLTEKAEWVKLSKDIAIGLVVMQFIRLSKEMTQHLKHIYIKALINGIQISQVLVDEGAMLNVMPIFTLKNLGKNKSDLNSTNMKMINFTSDINGCHWSIGGRHHSEAQNSQL